MHTISIIGLGWIGLPLARLLQAAGNPVIGSTTSEEKIRTLREEGIEAVQFSLNPQPVGTEYERLFLSDILVINIPPRSRMDGGIGYLKQLSYLSELLKTAPVKNILYVSSTGVYPDQQQATAYTEEEILDSERTGNINLWKAEEFLKTSLSQNLSIVRFGGLLGDDRIPGRYVSGKEHVPGHTRVNFIYRLDAARLLQFVIQKELWGTTFNGVAPLHPKRKAVYEKNCEALGIDPPASYAQQNPDEQRIISGEKIILAGFEFDYPNPLDFPYSTLH